MVCHLHCFAVFVYCDKVTIRPDTIIVYSFSYPVTIDNLIVGSATKIMENEGLDNVKIGKTSKNQQNKWKHHQTSSRNQG